MEYQPVIASPKKVNNRRIFSHSFEASQPLNQYNPQNLQPSYITSFNQPAQINYFKEPSNYNVKYFGREKQQVIQTKTHKAYSQKLYMKSQLMWLQKLKGDLRDLASSEKQILNDEIGLLKNFLKENLAQTFKKLTDSNNEKQETINTLANELEKLTEYCEQLTKKNELLIKKNEIVMKEILEMRNRSSFDNKENDEIVIPSRSISRRNSCSFVIEKKIYNLERLNEILQTHILKEKKSTEDLFENTSKTYEIDINSLKRKNEEIVNEYNERISKLIEQNQLLMKEKEDKVQEIILLKKENKILRENPSEIIGFRSPEKVRSDSLAQKTYDLHEEIKNDQEINKIFNEKIHLKNSLVVKTKTQNEKGKVRLDENQNSNLTCDAIDDLEEDEIYNEMKIEKIKGKGRKEYEKDVEIKERGNNCNACNVM